MACKTTAILLPQQISTTAKLLPQQILTTTKVFWLVWLTIHLSSSRGVIKVCQK